MRVIVIIRKLIINMIILSIMLTQIPEKNSIEIKEIIMFRKINDDYNTNDGDNENQNNDKIILKLKILQ